MWSIYSVKDLDDNVNYVGMTNNLHKAWWEQYSKNNLDNFKIEMLESFEYKHKARKRLSYWKGFCGLNFGPNDDERNYRVINVDGEKRDRFKILCRTLETTMRDANEEWLDFHIIAETQKIKQSDIWKILDLVSSIREVTNNSEMSLSDVVDYILFLVKSESLE